MVLGLYVWWEGGEEAGKGGRFDGLRRWTQGLPTWRGDALRLAAAACTETLSGNLPFCLCAVPAS